MGLRGVHVVSSQTQDLVANGAHYIVGTDMQESRLRLASIYWLLSIGHVRGLPFALLLLRRIVVQIWSKPTFHFGQAHSFTTAVVLGLVPADLADAEVSRLRMREVEPADTRT